MHIATDGLLLPTTVTGSWPRPVWYTQSLHGRLLSDGLHDMAYREHFLDAISVVLSDQERAGLDILTNGDFHLDNDLGGQSWVRYPLERTHGIHGPRVPGNAPRRSRIDPRRGVLRLAPSLCRR